MSKSNAFETALLSLIFNNDNIATLGDATGVRGSATAGSLYVSLHTADPGETGTQATNEAAYTGYDRVPVGRNSGSWAVSGDHVNPISNVDFGACTASPGASITHFGIGVNPTKATAGLLLYKGTLSAAIAMAIGVIPRLTPATQVNED